MFLGSYTPSFDVKSRRIALPKKIRQALKSNETILSFGFDKCIFGFSLEQWQKEAKQQLSQPLAENKARNIRRLIFSSAEHILLDDQGRFILPDVLRQYAKIIEPVVIGAGDHFEIWDEKTWRKERKKLEEVIL